MAREKKDHRREESRKRFLQNKGENTADFERLSKKCDYKFHA